MVNLITGLALAILISATSFAEVGCLDKLQNKVKPGSGITVLKQDETSLRAQFLRVNSAQDMLTVLPESDTTREVTLSLGEISQMQYRAPGKLKPLVMLGGFLFGAAGVVIYSLAVGEKAPFTSIYVLAVAGFFGTVGLVWGTIVSLSMNSTHYIKCE